MLHEVLHEGDDVLPAFAQRRQHERDDRDAVEQVLTETAFLHFLPQVFVRGGDEPEGRIDFPRAADPDKPLLLKDAEEFRLDRRRDVSHFVDEERPLVGHFEEAELLLDGSGERAALMAEELALEKVFRGARGVNGDERPAPAAHEVDLPGHDLLPDAGFPQNEHGRVRHAHVPDLFEQLPEAGSEQGGNVSVLLEHDGLEAFLLVPRFLVAHFFEAQGGAYFRGEQIGEGMEFGLMEVGEWAVGKGAVQVEQPKAGFADVERQTKPLLAASRSGRAVGKAVEPFEARAHLLAFQFHVGQVDGRDAGKPVVLVPPEQRSAFRLQFLLGDGDQAVQGAGQACFIGKSVERAVAAFHAGVLRAVVMPVTEGGEPVSLGMAG